MNRSVPSSFRTVHSMYPSELELKLRFNNYSVKDDPPGSLVIIVPATAIGAAAQGGFTPDELDGILQQLASKLKGLRKPARSISYSNTPSYGFGIRSIHCENRSCPLLSQSYALLVRYLPGINLSDQYLGYYPGRWEGERRRGRSGQQVRGAGSCPGWS